MVDSEEVLNSLHSAGWLYRKEPETARLVLLNTCGFIKEARAETLNILRRIAYLKMVEPGMRVYAFGCMVAGWKDWLEQKWGKSVDGFFPSAKDLLKYFRLNGSAFRNKRLTPSWYAYMKISEGCSRRCTFCIIPRLRGPQRSIPIPDLLREAQQLADSGVKELILVSQDAVNYGKDLSSPASLPALLRALSRIDGIEWIRLFYLYPSGVTPELLDAFHYPHILPYFDLPIQSFSQRVLRGMNRQGTVEGYFRLLEQIRREFFRPYMRTSVIVGFPGETEEDFEANLSAISEGHFCGLSAFVYSREKFSSSYSFQPQIPEAEKHRRLSLLMQRFEEVRPAVMSQWIGAEVPAVVENVNSTECRGRCWFQSPDVDGFTYWQDGFSAPGDLVSLQLTDVLEYDMLAVPALTHSQLCGGRK